MVVHLDCTLRDGGYYNNWDFDSELVNSYLTSLPATGVAICEIGFRFRNNDSFRGAYAHANDQFLSTLEVPAEVKLAVMINGSDLEADNLADSVQSLFIDKNTFSSPVDIVRIACHAAEIPVALEASSLLNSMGYRVGLNLMQISSLEDIDIRHVSQQMSGSNVEVFYFADSLGSMTHLDVERICGLIREDWVGPIGVHAHDNSGLALSNTLHAINHCGVEWVDSTYTGMGRGAGNTATEELMLELLSPKEAAKALPQVMRTVEKHFDPIKAKYKWGKNPYYYMAAKYSIHPTYIQRILSDTRFSLEDICAVIDQLSKEDSKKFSSQALGDAKNFFSSAGLGTWSPKPEFSGREVLVLATGQGVKSHREGIEQYIKKTIPIVLALNTQSEIDQNLIDYRVACNPTRILADSSNHICSGRRLITPYSSMPATVQESLLGADVFDFGLKLTDHDFEWNSNCAYLPRALVIAYALAVAAAGGAPRILLAGFDGYPAGDYRNEETMDVLSSFQAKYDGDLFSVTPTTHKIAGKSIYAL